MKENSENNEKYELHILSEPVTDDISVEYELPLLFKYKECVFKVEQLSVSDFDLFHELVRKDLYSLLIPNVPELFPNSDFDKTDLKLKYQLLHNRIKNKGYFKSLFKLMSRYVKPDNPKDYIRLIKNNIKNNPFHPSKWFISIKQFLYKNIGFDALSYLLLSIYGYNNYVKKKIYHILQVGIGKAFQETLTESQAFDLSGKSSNIGTIHQTIINRLKSRAS